MELPGGHDAGATGDVPDRATQNKATVQPAESAKGGDSLQAKSGSTVGDGQGVAVESAPVDLTRPTDEQILSYENQIRDEQRQKRPLLGDKEQTSSLREEYQDSSVTFVAKVEHLCSEYTFVRRTRQDGNCFYRAFLYGLLEALLISCATEASQAMLKMMQSLKQMLIDAGFMELVFEHAMEVLEDLLKAVASTEESHRLLVQPFLEAHCNFWLHRDTAPLRTGISTSMRLWRHEPAITLRAGLSDPSISKKLPDRMEPGELLVRLNDDDVCNMLVMLVRFVASAHVSRREDHFLPFILGMVDNCTGVDDFRRRHVEAMGEESDHIQVVAVAEAFQVPVLVVYLDNSGGSADGKMACNTHLFEPLQPFPGAQIPQVTVLYRPGHYDILYK